MTGGIGAVTGFPSPSVFGGTVGRGEPESDSGAGTATNIAWPLVTSLELGPLPTAAGCARLHAVHVLREWGLGELAGDAALIVSELMTNAADASVVLPERPPIMLRLLANETSLLIEAWDHSPLDLEPVEATADAECGRGLTVVAALSHKWGAGRTGHNRKVVWAELAL